MSTKLNKIRLERLNSRISKDERLNWSKVSKKKQIPNFTETWGPKNIFNPRINVIEILLFLKKKK